MTMSAEGMQSLAATPLLDNATMRHIHDLVLHTEGIRHRTIRMYPRSIKCVQTDALILAIPTRKLTSVRAVVRVDSRPLFLFSDYVCLIRL